MSYSKFSSIIYLILFCYLLSLTNLKCQDNISPSNFSPSGDMISINDNFSNNSDSVIINSSESFQSNSKKYISEKDFFYADTKRYTINGSLPLAETDLKTVPLIVLAGAYTGIFIMQHQLQMETIWKEQSEFKFMEDGKYAMYADKAGHFFGCYFTSYLARESLMLAGFSWDASNIIGTCLGFGYSSYVEVLDGFGKNWGFSWTDFYANVAGAGLFIGQHYVPFLQNFTPKFMYLPANWYGELKRVPHDAFIDDYSSHTLWLSVNVYNMLTEDMKKYWPSWLELSFGYAARNLCDPTKHKCNPCRSEPVYDYVWGNKKFIVALDYNLVKLLPEGGSFWNWLRQSLNYFKLPSPAVEFGNTTKFYLMYPFPIEIGDVRF